jgi:heavy metal sensor kinase
MTLRWRVALMGLAVLGAAQMALMALAYQVVRTTLWDDARERAAARAAQICTLLGHEDLEAITEAASTSGEENTASGPSSRDGAGGSLRRGTRRPAESRPRAKRNGPSADHPDELLRSPQALAAFAFDGALFRIRDGAGARVGVYASPKPLTGAAGQGEPSAEVRDVVIARRQVRLRRSQYLQPLEITVGWPLAAAERTLTRVALVLAGGGSMTLLLGMAITLTLVTRSLSPIGQISRQADAFSIGDLSNRLPEAERRDEVGQMVVAFNRLLERLDAAFQRERRFTADVAHELRTPLTILRGEIELALREHPDSPDPIGATLHSIHEEIAHLQTLVANLLSLARSENARAGTHAVGGLETEPVSLLDVSCEVIGRLGPTARQKGVNLYVCADSTAETVAGDSTMLRQAIFNVVQNAVRHSPAGGAVEVRVVRRDGAAVVEVRDAGPGIPREALPHIFDRFYRVEAARTRLPEQGQGLGLGLAITRAVVQAHGGQVDAENVPEGGARFRLSLPLRHG